MAHISVCLEVFFTDLDYKDRLARIHELGFKYYELWSYNQRFDGSNLIDEEKDFDMFAELNDKYHDQRSRKQSQRHE
jgi:hydroxypyruvate isomerase